MNTECIHYREAFPDMPEIPKDRRPTTSIADAELNGTAPDGTPLRHNWVIQRLVWTVKNGPIPRGQIIYHTCGNPHCINPAHLTVGKPGQTAKTRPNNLDTLKQFLRGLD